MRSQAVMICNRACTRIRVGLDICNAAVVNLERHCSKMEGILLLLPVCQRLSWKLAVCTIQ